MIQFSMVSVPVRVYTAAITGGGGVALNQLPDVGVRPAPKSPRHQRYGPATVEEGVIAVEKVAFDRILSS